MLTRLNAVGATFYPPNNTLLSQSIIWTNALQAGAKGGVANDTFLVQSLANKGIGIYFPNTTNYTLGTVYLTNNTQIMGMGTKISLLSTVSNAACFDNVTGGPNTNNKISGIILDGGAYGGAAGGGVTNRIGFYLYAYGYGNILEDCSAIGFDYGLRPYGDKTQTTSHQSPTLSIRGLTVNSNYCGVYFYSPDSSHVVEYIIVHGLNAFGNTIGALVDAGNINFVGCDFNNNGTGIIMPGTGNNNSHGIITGCKINHNAIGWALTNITLGEVFTGNQIQLNADGYVSNCRGIVFENNHITHVNMWFVQGSSAFPNFVFNNTCDGFGGGLQNTLSILDRDNSCLHWNNSSYLDGTGDYFVGYATNFPSAVGGAASAGLSHTNSFSIVDSNATGNFYFSANHGTAARVDYFIGVSGSINLLLGGASAGGVGGGINFGGALTGPSIFDNGNKLTSSGDSSGFQWNNQVNNTALAHIDNSGNFDFSAVGSGNGSGFSNVTAVVTNFTSYAAGTAYTLTATPAQLAFGTTSPSITIQNAGTYLIRGTVGVKYVSATYAGAQTITLKLRRTNNTAADITSGSRAVELPVLTTFTGGDVISPPEVVYTATAGDIVQLFGSVSATPSAGSVTTDSAEIVAIRLY